MKKLFSLLLMVFLLASCGKDAVIKYETTPDELDPMFGYELIRTVRVSRILPGTASVKQFVKEYEVWRKINMECTEPWYETSYDKYLIGWSGDYDCYKIIINGEEVDFIDGLTQRNVVFNMRDIEYSGIPVRIVEEYPYSISVPEVLKTVIHNQDEYLLIAQYVPSDYIELWLVSYTENYIEYVYHNSNVRHHVVINNNVYTIPEVFDMLNSGKLDFYIIKALDLPLEELQLIVPE
ncbi:hypothetical protein RJG79_00755 [Mycoplasmatota bacterium WC44]